jgi:hypothetical protein
MKEEEGRKEGRKEQRKKGGRGGGEAYGIIVLRSQGPLVPRAGSTDPLVIVAAPRVIVFIAAMTVAVVECRIGAVDAF